MTGKRNLVIKILLCFTALFVITNAVRVTYSPYVKQFASLGSYENSVEATAILIRDETVINPGVGGMYESYASEGERVSLGSSLGAVMTGDIDETKMSELNRLNAEIEALNKSISDAGVLSIEDSKVESTLSISVNNLRYNAAKNDVKSAVDLVEDIKILVGRKAGAVTSTTAQEELYNLSKKRDELASSLGGTHQKIYSTTYGLYSSKIDGLEQVLTYSNAMKATPQTVDSYFEMAEKGLNPIGVCKIVNNYKWHILLTLTLEECEGINLGKSYNVSFTELGEKQLPGVAKYISEPTDEGEVAVLMEFDKYVENFTYARITNVSICKAKYSGIYIPSKALRVNEGTLGVWVQNEISLEFKSIQVVFRSDDFVLVKENAEGSGGFDNIALYDNIVTDPDDE